MRGLIVYPLSNAAAADQIVLMKALYPEKILHQQLMLTRYSLQSDWLVIRFLNTIQKANLRMIKILTLFLDTNIFIQCKSLSEIDWSVLGDVDQVDLVVTRPVQVEIDRQKGKGTGRVARRARAAASKFGEALNCKDETLIITKGRPEVRLRVSTQLRPSEKSGITLNYSEPDDQLVGIAKAFSDANSGASVRVLTNDIGPRASAKAVGVACEIPREDWLLPPESDESEKTQKAIEDELQRYKRAEPSISLAPDNDNASQNGINGEYTIYPALSTEDLDTLTRTLQSRYPKETDFGAKEITHQIPDSRQPSIRATIEALRSVPARIFVPASDEEIDKYINTDYPKWVKDCDEKLRQIHLFFQSKVIPPHLNVRLANNGSRPAENCLISFEAKGSFLIKPSFQGGNPDITEVPPLNAPPSAPKGRWRNIRESIYGSALARAISAGSPFDIDAIQRLTPRARDDDAFYYKSGKPESPCARYSLECVRWRHQLNAENFNIDIYPSLSQGHTRGALSIAVHAANMTDSFTHLIQIHVEVNTGDTFAEAIRLIKGIT